MTPLPCLRWKAEGFIRGRNPEGHHSRLTALFCVIRFWHWRVGTDRHVDGDRIALPWCLRVHNLVTLYWTVVARGAPIRKKIADLVAGCGFPERVGLVRVAGHKRIKKLGGDPLLGVVAKREPNDKRQRNNHRSCREGKDVRLFLLLDARFQK